MDRDKRNKLILELYFNSDDIRLQTIADIVGCTAGTVSDVIQKYFQEDIYFEREFDYKIYHSSINYINNHQKW